MILCMVVIASQSARSQATEADSSDRAEERVAADSTSSLPIRFSLQGGHYYQSAFHSRISWPDYLRWEQAYKPDITYQWRDPRRQSVSDNPLFHGAGFIRIDLDSEPIEGLSLNAGLTGENRGMSYGVRDTKSMIVFPHFLFTFERGFPFLGDSLKASVAVGDFPAVRSSEPLMIYNIDVQGALFSVRWRVFEIYLEKAAGDMATGIGLNIDDANHQGIRLNDLALGDSVSLTAQAGLFIYPQTRRLDDPFLVIGERPINSYHHLSPRGSLLKAVGLHHYGYSAQLALKLPRLLGLDLHAVTSLALRDADTAGMMMNRMAFLAQVEASGKWKRGALDALAEYRYYGGLFNNGFRNDDPAYRDPEQTHYANTIGPFLYPLRNLDYPFSQWAVFTEYQDLKDVTAWTLYLKGKLFLIDRFVAHGTLDLNYVVPEKTDAFLYPFFSAAIGYEPIDDISATIGVTNRAMNLDKHYPTYYLLTTPTLEATIRWLVK